MTKLTSDVQALYAAEHDTALSMTSVHCTDSDCLILFCLKFTIHAVLVSVMKQAAVLHA